MKSLSFIFIAILSQKSYAAENLTALDLPLAQRIANKAATCGMKNNWKFSIAIVNSEGNLLYFQRGDGTYVGSIEAAIDKARSANAFQRPTKAFADGLKDGRFGLVTVKDAVGVEGGLPIQLSGKHAGGIGVSGAKSTEDEMCAKVALEIEKEEKAVKIQ